MTPCFTHRDLPRVQGSLNLGGLGVLMTQLPLRTCFDDLNVHDASLRSDFTQGITQGTDCQALDSPRVRVEFGALSLRERATFFSPFRSNLHLCTRILLVFSCTLRIALSKDAWVPFVSLCISPVVSGTNGIPSRSRADTTGLREDRAARYDRANSLYSSSYRSLHSGFIVLTRSSFFCREPPLICFSLAIAEPTSIVAS